jgi:hypothetical protein
MYKLEKGNYYVEISMIQIPKIRLKNGNEFPKFDLNLGIHQFYSCST